MRRIAAIVVVLLGACGDRSPRALWPEPPPPALAEPIGVADPSAPSASPPATVGDAKVEPPAQDADAKAEPAAASDAKSD